jgi:bifunctional UDP-N-acetylglucosamine pyrophosphorylase/glucosamine-1-phosphate N-acetyltransferase
MDKKMAVVLLAAGKGTRMQSDIPKVLTPILGKKLIDFPLINLLEYSENKSFKPHINLVIGHESEMVKNHIQSEFSQLNKNLGFTLQADPQGTAHALQCYFEQNPQAWEYEYTAVMCGDMPLIDSGVINKITDYAFTKGVDGVAATFETPDPTGFGRIKRGDKGFSIIEHKDCSASDLLIKEANSGFYVLKTSFIKEFLSQIGNNNNSSEFYLTDLFGTDRNVFPFCFRDQELFLGVNNQIQKHQVIQSLRDKKFAQLLSQGVEIMDFNSCFVEWDVQIGKGTVLHPNTYFYGKTTIGLNNNIEPGVVIKDATIGNENKILANSYIEDTEIKNQSQIGPMARLRPGTVISNNCKIGNFVEVKKAIFQDRSQASHLSYIGDANIGEGTNIGCGFITCNYDGANKHQTIIGKNSFIGSDCQAIAPVEIGDECFIAAGSTITHSLQNGDFAIARSKQVTKDGMAKKFLKSKK